LNEDNGCYAFIKECQKAGKIKHIGFSSHGTGETIMRMVESNKFDYINVHAHYFGDYHGEGTPDTQGGHGNKAAVKKALELDMGVFLISPFDKGGKLYLPSKTVAKTVGPELTPISFASLYAWKKEGFHTVSVGFSKVSDLDEVVEAAYLYTQENTLDVLDKAVANLEKLAADKLGQDWVDKGMLNIPSCLKESTNGVAIGHILWLHNVCTAYGMYDFARERYKNLMSTSWDDKKTFEENVAKMGSGNCGRGHQPDVDLTEALKDHYYPELVKKKLMEVHEYLSSKHDMTDEDRQTRGFEQAYNLTVWGEFCGDTETLSAPKLVLQSLTGGYFGVNNTTQRRSSQADARKLRGTFAKALEDLGDDN
jgi:predicted aldo/keto reductase-like oxidoreductase